MIDTHQRAHIMRAVTRLVKAAIADSWKGGGYVEDIPSIEADLAHATATLNERLDAITVRAGADTVRLEFEGAMYQHYLRKRAERAAKGQGIVLDDPDAPRAPDNLFQRTESGEYVAVIYQAAWTGWKMARGVA